MGKNCMIELNQNRRAFLRFLAASPALPVAVRELWAQDASALLKDPSQALSVFDFEVAARAVLPPAHLGYLVSGVDDEMTLKANREGFQQYKLRARRLVDVSKTDLTTESMGIHLDHPILVCPVGGQMAFHADGELGTARGAAATKTQMILSTQTTKPIEDVIKAAGRPIWFQLYVSRERERAEDLMHRAEANGYDTLILTVDTAVGGIRRREVRNGLTIPPQLSMRTLAQMAMYPRWWVNALTTDPLEFATLSSPSGTVGDLLTRVFDASITADDIAWLRGVWKGPLMLKGVQSVDDARVAKIANGHAMMTRVTGMGCTASALTGALAAVHTSAFEAARNVMVLMRVAGEMAVERAAGPGSLQMHFLDVLHGMREADLIARARVQDG